MRYEREFITIKGTRYEIVSVDREVEEKDLNYDDIFDSLATLEAEDKAFEIMPGHIWLVEYDA